MDDHIQDSQPTATAEPSSPLTWTPEHNAYTLSAAAIENNSTSELKESLVLARTFLPKFDTNYTQFRNEVFHDILSHHSINLLTYMLDHEGVPVSLVTPNSIFQWASKSLIEALVSRGWDINVQDGAAFNGKRLIDYFVRERYEKEDLARWLVEEKGAAVDNGKSDTDSEDMTSQPPPLLETCAAFGSVPMFKFLEAKGAKSSRRILHVAVETAAVKGADPYCEVPTQSSGERTRNMGVEMLRYLVDERQLDVNAMDVDGPPKSPINNHWGTPICYAARCRNGASVVRWLLDKGADPSFKNPYSGFDALAYAREVKCDEIVNVLEEWQWNNG